MNVLICFIWNHSSLSYNRHYENGIICSYVIGYVTWETVFHGSYTISVITYLYFRMVYK